MKKLVKFFTVLLSLTVLVCLAGCKKEPVQYTAQQMADAIQFDNDKKDVTFEFVVDKQVERLYEGSETEKQVAPITWTSNDSRVRIEDNKVFIEYDAANNTAAKIKGEVEVNGEKASQEFQFRIVPESTFAEYSKASKGTKMSVSGYISHLGEYSASYKNFSMQVVAKDKQHSYYAYRASCDAETYKQLSVGRLVGLTGEVDDYNGKQLAKASVTPLTAEDYVETPFELTLDDISTNKKFDAQLNRLVKISAEVISHPFDDKKGSVRVNALLGDREIQIQNNKNFYESGSADADAVKKVILDLKPADVVTFEGYLGKYNSTPTFTVVKPSAMAVQNGDPNRADVIIAKANVEQTLLKADCTKAGEIKFDLPEGVNAEITLDNNEQQVVKVVDGKLVLAPTKVEVTVKVTVKLTKNNQTLTAEQEIDVRLPIQEPERPAHIDLTITPKVLSKSTKLENKPNYADMFDGLDPKVWTVTNIASGTGSEGAKHNNPAAIKECLKLYANASDGNGTSITFSNEETEYNYVVITIMAAEKSTGKKINVNGIIYDIPTEGQYVIKLEKAAKEITIKNVDRRTSTQTWISKIELAK